MIWWLLESTIIVAFLATVVSLACRVVRCSPAVRHALWLILLMKFVLPPLVPAPWTPLDLTDVFSPTEAAVGRVTPAGVQGSGFRVQDGQGALPLARYDSPLWQDTVGQFTGLDERRTTSASSMAASWASVWAGWRKAFEEGYAGTWIAAFWLTAGCFIAARQGVWLRRMQRLSRSGRKAPKWLHRKVATVAAALRVRAPRVVVAEGIRTPFVWCLGRPQLFWPAALIEPSDPTRWQGVIIHELAHLRRKDHWVAWIELAAQFLWWWNPIFWYVRSQLRASAEQACDAWVVSMLPHARRMYAESIVEVTKLVSQTVLPVPALGASSGARRTFQRRLTMIVCERVPCQLSWGGLAAAALLGILALPSWLVAQAPASKKTAAPPAAADKPTDASPAKPAKSGPLEVGGVVKAASVATNTITVGGKQLERTFSVAKDVRVLLDDGTGDRFGFHEGKLSDVVEGLHVTLRLSPDQTEVIGIWAEGPDLKGTLKSVDPAKNSVTVAVTLTKGEPEQDKAFEVAKNAKVIIFDSKGKDKGLAPVPAPTLADLPLGALVALKLSADQKTVGRIQADGPSLHGTLKALDAEKNTLTLHVVRTKGEPGEDHTYSLAKDAKVSIDGALGKLSDLPMDAAATIKLSLNQKEVVGIQVEGPMYHGTVKVVDITSRTLIIDAKESERTFTVATDASVFVDGKQRKLDDVPAEAFVAVKLSADQKTVRSLSADGRKVQGTLKTIDEANKEITIDIPKEGPTTFKFAADVKVSTSKNGEALKLADLKPDKEIVLLLSADQKLARVIVLLED